MKQSDIVIFEADNGEIVVDVRLVGGSVWLSLTQLAVLFERDKSVISRHLNNIFKEGELRRDATVAFFATVQQEKARKVTRQIEYYNLDGILSVGYRVNSKRGTQFRRWASKILQDHLLKGYSLNQKLLDKQRIVELENSLDLLTCTLTGQSLVSDLGVEVINVVRGYAKTWTVLLEYDEGVLNINTITDRSSLIDLDYESSLASIKSLATDLVRKGEASSLFGLERQGALQGILGNLSQTFNGVPVYPTNIERAAHLLYFVIKDHPFSDGNKRIGSFLFLLFLGLAGVELAHITNNSLVALALLIAESSPTQKDIIIKLVIRLIT
jgi:DNA ligase (NAD+)